MSNDRDNYIGYSYKDCYLALIDIDYAGVDGIGEYYFVCRDTYEEAGTKILDVFRSVADPRSMAVVTQVEDPILSSPEHKYVIYLREPFGHFILNTVANMAFIHKSDPDAIFVIVTGPTQFGESSWVGSHRQKLIDFLVQICKNKGINYYIIQSSNVHVNLNSINNTSGVYKVVGKEPFDDKVSNYFIYEAKNITTIDTGQSTLRLTIKDIISLVNEYINDFTSQREEPRRKIYITRGAYDSDPDPFVVNEDSSIGYKSGSVRIYDEGDLENYLAGLGFEIINLEDLERIQDQVDIMNNAAIVVGATGTGLINHIFMREGMTVIELRVELGRLEQEHRIVPDYFHLSAGKRHLHITLDVEDKQAKTAIERLDQIFSNLDIDGLIEGRAGNKRLH